jgi:hypothetical protein
MKPTHYMDAALAAEGISYPACRAGGLRRSMSLARLPSTLDARKVTCLTCLRSMNLSTEQGITLIAP